MIGLREIGILAVVVLILYGRSGVLKSRQFQTIWPWLSPVRRTARRPGDLQGGAMVPEQATRTPSSSNNRPTRSKRFRLDGNRLFWFLTILAATAVAALIVTRMLILSGPGPGLVR